MFVKTNSDGPNVYWRVPKIINQIFFFRWSQCLLDRRVPRIIYQISVGKEGGLGWGIDVRGVEVVL